MTHDLTTLVDLCEYWNKGRLYEILWEYACLTPSILRARKARGWLYREEGRLAGFALGRQRFRWWHLEELWGPCEGSSELEQPVHPHDSVRARHFGTLLNSLGHRVLIRAAADNPFANLLARKSGAKWHGGYLLSKKSLQRRCRVSTPRNCILRRFKRGDEHHLSKIHRQAFGYPYSPSKYRQWATLPNCRTTLAILDDRPVGFFISEKRPYKGYGDFNIAVDSSAQGRGIGSALLQNGLNDLIDMGVTTAIADYLLLNARAQTLYRKHRFQIARVYNYYTLEGAKHSRPAESRTPSSSR